MASITIRPIIEADKPQWEKLYHGYADHYQVTLTETGLNCTSGGKALKLTGGDSISIVELKTLHEGWMPDLMAKSPQR